MDSVNGLFTVLRRSHGWLRLQRKRPGAINSNLHLRIQQLKTISYRFKYSLVSPRWEDLKNFELVVWSGKNYEDGVLWSFMLYSFTGTKYKLTVCIVSSEGVTWKNYTLSNAGSYSKVLSIPYWQEGDWEWMGKLTTFTLLSCSCNSPTDESTPT